MQTSASVSASSESLPGIAAVVSQIDDMAPELSSSVFLDSLSVLGFD
jgi:hypothetical protein